MVEIDRGEFMRLGVAGFVGTVGAGVLAGPAAAALPVGLLVGGYLNGAAFSRDGATRLLLGRLLTYDAQQLAWMRGLTGGAAATGLPIPLDLEQAGPQLDRLLTTPSFTV